MATLEQIDLESLRILKLRGSLDSLGIEEVEPGLMREIRKGGRVVVDLTLVDIVTTPAISMFIAAASAARSAGGKVIFTESTRPVREVLQRLRLHEILQFITGLTEAIKAAQA